MGFDPYSTYWLQKSIQLLPPVNTFLKNRYFPDAETFKTASVLVEYKNGLRKAAPFTSKRSSGIELERTGSELKEFMPALIAPKRTLTLETLEHRGFGEQLNSQMTEEQRALYYNTQDLNELRPTIAITKEAMASQVIFENKLTITEYTDDLSDGRDREIKFYEGTNDAIYTPSKNWDYTEESGKQIIADIYAMIQKQSTRGLPATELLCSPEATDILLNNVYIQKMLDNRRIEIGKIAPTELMDGATEFMVLNIHGRNISFISYDNTYVGLDNKLKPFIPAGYVALAAPASGGVAGTNLIGQTLYGSVSQLEDDDKFHTYTGTEVPQFVSDKKSNVQTLTLRSAPLLMPIAPNPFVVAKVTA